MNTKYLLSKVETVDNNVLYSIIDLKTYDAVNIERFLTAFKLFIEEEKPIKNFITESSDGEELTRNALSRRSNASYNVLTQFDFVSNLLPLTEKPIKNILLLKIIEIVNENELFDISDYIEIINQK